MCGIVGYTGKRQAAPLLLAGLKKLEYRGYDSAGIAVETKSGIAIEKREGRVSKLQCEGLTGGVGIGHTRWATHGAPSERNAHPHRYGKIVVVHNGIIENDLALKQECLARGEIFSSDTDSETIAHMIAHRGGDLLTAVKETCRRLSGSYALAVLSEDEKGTIVCARMKSPLIVGLGEDGACAASDMPAIAEKGRTLYALEDGEFAVLTASSVQIYDNNLHPIRRDPLEYDSSAEDSRLGDYHHYMRKEMAEIPAVLAKNLPNFANEPSFSEFYKVLCHTEYIQIVACGTAYHSGLCAKHAIEKLCRVPVEVSVASEYRYCDPIVPKNTLCLAVSQSGETADTLAAAEIAKERGAKLVAVTNVSYSSLTRLADFVLPTNAGQETAVAATKSFNAQLLLLYGIARALAESKGRTAPSLEGLAPLAEKTLEGSEDVRSWTPYFVEVKSVFFLGRGADYCTALEGSLKLKEISYIPSEGYSAGELKHGTLALVDEKTPVVAIITDPNLAEKTMNAVHEVSSRGAKVFLVTSLPEYCKRKEVFASVVVPPFAEAFSPILSVIPLQALAYYTALARGNDPDKPRNLAKSVTVE